jgi:hypothetical protein
MKNELKELKKIAPSFGWAVLLIGGGWVYIVSLWAIFGK